MLPRARIHMDLHEATSDKFEDLINAFANQLKACLQECARGRDGLFSDVELVSDEGNPRAWPEASRLRELAVALQSILSQAGESDALCDEFLDLCSMHGEHHPGEQRLARMFLGRIEQGEVGTPTESKKQW